ncbi:two-component sensor histidine kinase [Oceanobacillus arenosus]|uniref:Heme sensor protein HssS n=1 Tax=Oceanobacillus arenosus TaxID=1229153 RepID=A0A3D8PKN3_9BACI|nr:HAMP domain-containing sensor histidine kinase [Oceanobacillus arenosus]RDW16037.1 two-component sensor histidine kinase [Oceanobacillus arenosus]
MKLKIKFKHFFRFRSVYVKFAVTFLGIWYSLNALTFFIAMHFMSGDNIELEGIRRVTGLVFLNSAIYGTIVILAVVRSILKPLKRLSNAAREVAKGDFDVLVMEDSIDEVGRLTSDFNKMVKELRSIDNLRREFVSNVSHEFRTPVASIKGYAKLISEDEKASQSIKDFSSIIMTESDRLIDLSSNLLRLSELDTQIIHKETVFSLDEQIRQAILILESGWGQKGIEYEVDLAEVQFIGDEELLFQVWVNLIQNAIKFSHHGGTISILLSEEDDKIQFKITDNGIGISYEEKSRIFERFYKGEMSRKKSGNGLGLSIVKKIVEQARGKILIESELDKGTIVIVILPK